MDVAIEKGYIFANVYLSELNNPEEELVGSEEKSLEEIENDYLEKLHYSGKQLELAIEMIKRFGLKMSQADLEKATTDLIKMGEDI